ncbi:MAG: beta-lactamase family protein [Candidatus Delongbacteria bacterium]|nr:beta-lactamase family protein [Candidatus Delongbacteria bacterium]MBN2835482.1 beta-lactamase family protein [Candidatus Delongbacteria bacterium]
MTLIKQKFFLIFTSILLASSTLIFSQESTKNFHPNLSFDELKTKVENTISKNNIPGAAIAIVSSDSILWMETFGFANLENRVPVTKNTLFCIGSCTKSFTGLAFLKLLSEGKIDLNTPIKEIVPEIEIDNPWESTDPVRIIHLLEHTSGFEDSHLNWFYFEKPELTIEQALSKKSHLRKVRWRPGTRFSYSSPGFTLAGYILEKISGQIYQEYIKQELFEPLRMKTASIGCSPECHKIKAVGYGNENTALPIYYDFDKPAGALNSSIEDMALFVQFLLNKGYVNHQEIINSVHFDKIGKPISTLASQAGLESGYSFGIGTRFKKGVKWLGHSGAVPGFASEYFFNADQGIGFVILQNSFDTNFNDDIFSLVWNYISSVTVSSTSAPKIQLSSEQTLKYCGYYEPRNPRMRIMEIGDKLSGGLNVFMENDTLYYKYFGGERKPFYAVSQNTFRREMDTEATYVFFSNRDGEMAIATGSSYFEQIPGWKPIVYRVLVFGALIIMVLSIANSLFWFPVYLYKRLTKKDNYFKNIWTRILPLLTVLSLILGIVPFILKQPTMLELGMKTIPNIIFCSSTLLYTGLSVLSICIVIMNINKMRNKFDLYFTVILSTVNIGMTLYLAYWGIIGLKLWIY